MNDDDFKGYVTLGKTYTQGNDDELQVYMDDYLNYKFNINKYSVFDAAEIATIDNREEKIQELEDRFEEFSDEMFGRIEAIEEQIVLVRRDNALEKDFDELKEAWEKYNEILEKLRTFKALQDSA